MIKEKKCKAFRRPEYCLQIAVDCIHCTRQIDKSFDCEGNNSTSNYKEE